MDSLRAMFPDVPPQTLSSLLAAHNNSVQHTVDYLLSSPSPDARLAQERSDHELAQRLQAEEQIAQQDQQPNPPFALPSLADVASAASALVDGAQSAGKAALDGATALYYQLVGTDNAISSHNHPRPSRLNDDAHVIRGASGSGDNGPRLRRTAMSSSMGSTSKKDA